MVTALVAVVAGIDACFLSMTPDGAEVLAAGADGGGDPRAGPGDGRADSPSMPHADAGSSAA
jgi:hypothetical protein